MAIGPKTQFLIASYARKNAHDAEQKVQATQALNGTTIYDSEDKLLFEHDGLEDVIASYEPVINGLDEAVVAANDLVRAKQQELKNVYVGSISELCSAEVPLTQAEDDEETQNWVYMVFDDVRGYSWDFSGDNPFDASNRIITSNNNIGYGTYTGITTTAESRYWEIGTAPLDPEDTYGDCASYASTAAQIRSEIVTLRAQRDSLIATGVNILKEDRAQHYLAEWAYRNSLARLDANIATRNSVIDTIKANASYIKE